MTTIDYSNEGNGRHPGQMLLRLLAGTPARTPRQLERVHLLVRDSDHPV